MGQQARWLDLLSEFEFVVEYRPGYKHGNADALSHRSCCSCLFCREPKESECMSTFTSSETRPDSEDRWAFWENWRGDIERCCCRCESGCRYHRLAAPRQGEMKDMVMGAPWENVGMDLTGRHMRFRRGNYLILTYPDHLLNSRRPTLSPIT